MKICHNCGMENPDSSNFCVNCGSSLAAASGIVSQETRDITAEEMEAMLKEIGPETPKNDDAEKDAERATMPAGAVPVTEPVNADKRPYHEGPGHEHDGKKKSAGKRKTKSNIKNKKVIFTAVLLVLVILVGGIIAFVAVRNYSDEISTDEGEKQHLSQDMIDELNRDKVSSSSTPSPTPAPEPTRDSTKEMEPIPTAEPTPTPEPTPEPMTDVSATMELGSAEGSVGYMRLDVKEAEATSTIDAAGIDNSPVMLLNSDDSTCWQEGVPGFGIGERLRFSLAGTYSVHCIVLKVGKWASPESYWNNGRPSDLSIWLNDTGFSVELPDERTVCCITFSKDIPCTEVMIEIDGVYPGNVYEDTCMTEVGIYGLPYTY